MKKLILATVSVLALGAASAQAQQADDQSKELLGGGAGAGVGAAAGAVVGGPIGAVVGGFAGAVIGAETAVPEPAVKYAVSNPVEPVTIEGEVKEGVAIPQGVAVQQIPDYPEYSYVYIDGRPVIVDSDAHKVVYSPGYAVSDNTVAYVQENPIDPVTVDTQLTVGAQVPASVQIQPVPDAPAYGYVYTDAGPVLVQNNTRTVVWVKG